MATIIEIEKLALNLPDKERATLAANLLDSLPGVLSDEDERIAEALRRDAEASVNPESTISLTDLDSQIESRPPLNRRDLLNRSLTSLVRHLPDFSKTRAILVPSSYSIS